AMNEKLKLVPARVSKVFPSGRKVVYKLTFKSGKVIMGSGNHPFYSLAGWKRLDKLEKGERIATPRILSTRSVKESKLNNNRLILLAHLIGDGCYVKRQPLHYTNSDMELIKMVEKAAKSEFAVIPRIVKQESWFHLYLSAAAKLARGIRNPIVKWLDEDLNIYGQRSKEKHVPEKVFVQDVKGIALFLKHLWSTDGCVYVYNKGKRKVTLYYASSSITLARDVSHLLLKLGILSTITKSIKKGYDPVFNVQVQGKVQQLKFFKEIGIVGKKQIKAKEAINLLESIEENPNNDVIPSEVWSMIEKIRVDRNLTTREFHKKLGWSYSGTQRHKNGVSRKRLKKINSLLKDDQLMNIINSDLFWDEVVDIKRIGTKKVYDVTVPKCASFVANDIIVHNSIEQDSDVVMFIWREDEEKIENVSIEIAKHRNGPLRSIKMFFRGDRIKFYGRETKRAD
ncbi:LAGLIDADG family homing endonuclease, partial [Patescibacteria group bacterium]